MDLPQGQDTPVNWYCHLNGQTYGPYLRDTLLYCDAPGMPQEWVKAEFTMMARWFGAGGPQTAPTVEMDWEQEEQERWRQEEKARRYETFRKDVQAANNAGKKNNEVRCPSCGSTQITAKNQGFGLGKAAVGGLLLGPVGLLGGVIGSKNTKVVCLKCGREWTPSLIGALIDNMQNS